MARKKKSRPIVREFNEYFGAGALEDWQRLCQDVRLDGDYRSITQCRKVLNEQIQALNHRSRITQANHKG